MLNKKGVELTLRMLIIVFIVGLVSLLLLLAFMKTGVINTKSLFDIFVFSKGSSLG